MADLVPEDDTEMAEVVRLVSAQMDAQVHLASDEMADPVLQGRALTLRFSLLGQEWLRSQ